MSRILRENYAGGRGNELLFSEENDTMKKIRPQSFLALPEHIKQKGSRRDGIRPAAREKNMDIQKSIQEIVEKITKDDSLMSSFKKDPMAAIKKLIKEEMPEDLLEKIVEGVKAKISLDKAGDLLGSMKKLF